MLFCLWRVSFSSTASISPDRPFFFFKAASSSLLPVPCSLWLKLLCARNLDFSIFSKYFVCFVIHPLFGNLSVFVLQTAWWVHTLLQTSQVCLSPGSCLFLVLVALHMYSSTNSTIDALHGLRSFAPNSCTFTFSHVPKLMPS